MKKEYIFLTAVLKQDTRAACSIIKDLDFDFMENIIKRNYVAGVFYDNIKKMGFLDAMPYRDMLINSYYANMARNVKLEMVFLDIARKAKEANIEILPLKGINLIKFIYPNIGARPLADIDILCHEEDYQRLKALLVSEGFVYGKKNDIDTDRVNFDFIKEGSNKKVSTSVEAHTQISPSRPHKPKLNLFKRKIDIGGIYYLSKEDLFINMLFKIRRDARNLNIIYFYDLYLILKKEKMDWDYIKAACHADNISNVLYFALYFLDEIFGERFYDYPDKAFYRFFKGRDIYKWNCFKGYFLRMCFFNVITDIPYYIFKKWL